MLHTAAWRGGARAAAHRRSLRKQEQRTLGVPTALGSQQLTQGMKPGCDMLPELLQQPLPRKLLPQSWPQQQRTPRKQALSALQLPPRLPQSLLMPWLLTRGLRMPLRKRLLLQNRQPQPRTPRRRTTCPLPLLLHRLPRSLRMLPRPTRALLLQLPRP